MKANDKAQTDMHSRRWGILCRVLAVIAILCAVGALVSIYKESKLLVGIFVSAHIASYFLICLAMRKMAKQIIRDRGNDVIDGNGKENDDEY